MCAPEQLTARLRERFPLGSPRAALVTELRREGFRLDPRRNEAIFVGGYWPTCEIDTLVTWSESNGSLTDISGMTTETCL